MTLKSMEKMLPKSRFLRVHRSFLVALDKVESLRRKTLMIQQHEIPIGITYYEQIKPFFQTK